MGRTGVPRVVCSRPATSFSTCRRTTKSPATTPAPTSSSTTSTTTSTRPGRRRRGGGGGGGSRSVRGGSAEAKDRLHADRQSRVGADGPHTRENPGHERDPVERVVPDGQRLPLGP